MDAFDTDLHLIQCAVILLGTNLMDILLKRFRIRKNLVTAFQKSGGNPSNDITIAQVYYH
jgi:hypothetical protein